MSGEAFILARPDLSQDGGSVWVARRDHPTAGRKALWLFAVEQAAAAFLPTRHMRRMLGSVRRASGCAASHSRTRPSAER